MNIKEFETFIKERDEMIIHFMKTGDIEPAIRYWKKYNPEMPLPSSDTAIKAGLYKCVCNMTNMPEKYKQKARFMLKLLGMSENFY